MLMPNWKINVLRPLFSAHHGLCGLPSVTIQSDSDRIALKPAFSRFFCACALHFCTFAAHYE
jgi:hypothetical protein